MRPRERRQGQKPLWLIVGGLIVELAFGSGCLGDEVNEVESATDADIGIDGPGGDVEIGDVDTADASGDALCAADAIDETGDLGDAEGETTIPPPEGFVFPGSEWETADPDSVGINPANLEEALEYFDRHAGGVGTNEMVIIRNGYLIWSGPDIDNRHEIYSCTKTFTSTVLGLLVTQGVLNVDDFATLYLPSFDDDYPEYGEIRLSHLASMSAGYLAIRNDCWSLHQEGRHEESYACTQAYTIPGDPDYTPGESWRYSDPSVHMLGYILTLVAGEPLESVFRTEVGDRIGMTDWDWSDYGMRDSYVLNNPAGTPNDPDATAMNDIQGGLYVTAQDLARYALLYLARGNWNGVQILDTSFVELAGTNVVPASTRPAASFDLTGRYGFYWWTNGVRADGTRPWPSAPDDAYTAHGVSRNFIFIIPEWNMAIVRMSPYSQSSLTNPSDSTWEGFFSRLRDGIGPVPESIGP